MQDAIILHIIFTIKDNGFDISADFTKKMVSHLEFACLNQDCRLLEAECLKDHLHILIRIRQELSVSQVVQTLKRDSQTWVQNEYFKDFCWKPGYSAFSLSTEKVAGVAALIDNQKKLHDTISYKDELEIMINDDFDNIRY